MKLVIYPDVDIWKYVLSGVAGRSDIILFPLNRHCNILQRLLRKTSLGLPSSALLGSTLRRAIASMKAGDTLLLCDYSSISLTSAIARILPSGVTSYLWLWNHKSHTAESLKQLQTIKQTGFSISTYHEQDADFFQLNWHPQFFCIHHSEKDIPVKEQPIMDFLYVGYQKDRGSEISAIFQSLSSFRCRFITVHSEIDYVPYTHYMQMAAQSRCIVEIVHSGAYACTLRPLEALSLRRKLLTNDPNIRRASYYHPQNIFVWGEDRIESLTEFLQAPFIPLSADIVTQHDVNHWIDSFN